MVFQMKLLVRISNLNLIPNRNLLTPSYSGPIMCSASTMHRALVDSGLKPGNWVVFPGGGGGVGIQGVQLAKYERPVQSTPILANMV
jgi:D-arabinose 1-dehydrogenase-like Zn-dependent alcohol dehydrogenase